MKKFYINRLSNNYVSEYKNSDGDHYSDLVSFGKRVASYNHKTNEISVYCIDSRATINHINYFLEFYGFDICTKKELETYYL
jgi:hypothetical protein